jgi:hypothetical protein
MNKEKAEGHRIRYFCVMIPSTAKHDMPERSHKSLYLQTSEHVLTTHDKYLVQEYKVASMDGECTEYKRRSGMPIH